MDSSSAECANPAVNEGAFWQTNMDLFYGYQFGEVVEVEHEAGKYWLATVEFSYKKLILLKWIGDFGDFWVDTSQQSSTSSNEAIDAFNTPRRLFPPGHHLQSQIKSLFVLEKPSKILKHPSIYDPAKDPYSSIKNVDDLLAFEATNEQDNPEQQASQSNCDETTSQASVPCEIKVEYRQEDVDELMIALRNLDDPETAVNNAETHESEQPKQIADDPSEKNSDNDLVEVCRQIQKSAISRGRYVGLGKNSDKVYYLRPKQFFENDGCDANDQPDGTRVIADKDDLDFDSMSDKKSDLGYILNQKSSYISIYFNHKCFTGPSLSKGKICSLPHHVGPGPLGLVMEEVINKIISVAYVPPRILNDLSSKNFEDLLVARNMHNTIPMEFKAKYQKRVHREYVHVCINPDDVVRYCECVCEHLKCCYNLFGPNLYDGDDCPSHCRVLTKSNKFMKRASYYLEKARNGEFLNDNSASKKTSSNNGGGKSKTSRARYGGRNSSDSTSSKASSKNAKSVSRGSPSIDEFATKNNVKENLAALNELDGENNNCMAITDDTSSSATPENFAQIDDYSVARKKLCSDNKKRKVLDHLEKCDSDLKLPTEMSEKPDLWSIEDVGLFLELNGLSQFRPYIESEGIDGQALLLLDTNAIEEHSQVQPRPEYSSDEISQFGRLLESMQLRFTSY